MLRTPVDAKYPEQPIFYHLHDMLNDAKRKIHIYEPRGELQAFLKIKTDLRDDSWIVHATQSGSDLASYIKQTECLSQRKK